MQGELGPEVKMNAYVPMDDEHTLQWEIMLRTDGQDRGRGRLPIVRAGCALGMPEYLDYDADRLPPSRAGVNREGRLCVQIGVLGTPREPFTSFQMIGLAAILSWLDSWRIPRRWPAGQPAPYRQLARPRSRALWALGGHFGASQVPECDNLGPGGIDIDHLTRLDASIACELAEPAPANGSPVRLGARTHELRAAAV